MTNMPIKHLSVPVSQKR